MAEQWLEVTLTAPPEELDEICAKLTANGAEGLVIEEEGDFLKFLEENRQYWDYVDEKLMERMRGVSRVKFYVKDDEEGAAQLAKYLKGLEWLEVQTAPVREEDWSTSWQRYYRPMAVGKKLYIVPQWLRDEPIPEGRAPLYLNPGLTFGTGSHATTRLCLELLEETLKPGNRVLDLGCGSGILGIAALRLGAAHVTAVDIDPKAVDAAYENAALNGFGRDRLTALTGDVLTDPALRERLGRGNQIVLANIVADVIIPLSAVAGGFLQPGGAFLASGILAEREPEVTAALASNGFRAVCRREQSGWCAGFFSL